MRQSEENRLGWRVVAFHSAVLVAFILLVARLAYIQFLEKESLELIADQQYKCEVKLSPQRGLILDRHLRPLAMNIPAVSIMANTREIADKVHTSRVLSQILGQPASHFLLRLQSQSGWVALAWNVSPEMGARLAKTGLPGIQLQDSWARSYPKGRIGSQVLGFVSVEGKGLGGIEGSCDALLRGKPGKAIMQKLATGKTAQLFERPEYPKISPIDGSDVVLTIDCFYQSIVERNLQQAIAETEADSGAVVVMDPFSGEILAMASAPNYDPNRPSDFHPSSHRMRAISDQYEPGSTFKLVLVSAALDIDLKRPEDEVFCENGKFEIMNETLHDTSPYGRLSLADVLAKSSNIGAAKTALEMDKAKFYRYARDFGFGVRTGVELPGEADGVLKPVSQWSGYTPIAMAIGYEIAATPLQMCTMLCTIANGGLLLKPTLVRQVRQGEQVLSNRAPREVVRYVIKKHTAMTMKDLMQRVVEVGTGRKAQIPGLQVCGKTGTSRMVRRDGNGYSRTNYVSSFGGFFPKENPKIAIFVVIHNPRSGFYGGDVAAPCFRAISEELIYHEGSDYFDLKKQDVVVAENPVPVPVPVLIGFNRDVARNAAIKAGLKIKWMGSGDIVIEQKPDPNTLLGLEDEVVLWTAEADSRIVPNVEGLPIRNALNLLAANGIRAVVDGTGKVVKQQPFAGHEIKSDEQVLLRCESSIDLKKLIIL
ncbi:MAG TPA: penicillin-binding transpeptidase domain-containing protein [bacterium]|nr:penicillin-binding transpeptidase domain-containing protein [bacterium]HNT65600.1 penicillin-binding transpeptidase domain-containing protein [bacterium]HOX86176.1 penicillin-binding transpeptidase domain-containing protein [bacterium]HPG45610.1 penicillin-binding transpeptidase domain-containing protein [bacterium]HPM97611.1 penicillin-binding transpeptidase domain-containing protein [bacterium]